jgi:N-acetylglucosamine kinase-like BadF-type ATPase
MKIIADSGSTNTQWCLMDQNDSHQVRTRGLNPFFNGASHLEKEIRKQPLLRDNQMQVSKVFFYGAGCGNEKNAKTMASALKASFPKAEVFVETDLLGAARGLFIGDKGIAGILGTGSHSGLYNGKNIIRCTPSLGYLLGDEGSGSHLGQALLKAYLGHELPQEVTKKFRENFPGSSESLIYELYNHPFPNRYLAGFTPFIRENQEHPFLNQLLSQAFTSFFNLLKKHYSPEMLKSVRLIGSVASGFSELVTATGYDLGIQVTRIKASPMDGLIHYHTDDK